MRRLIFVIAICFLWGIAAHAQKDKPLKYTIAPWFGNKQAAVSLTFDDGLIGQFNVAMPLLDKYRYKGTFFMTVSIVNDQHISWDLLRKAARNGHEIANHALTHPHFIKLSAKTIAQECVECNKQLDKLIPGQRTLTHAYPFGEGGGSTDTDRAVRNAVAPYFIGARATQNKAYGYNRYNFAQTNDDYYNVNSRMIADAASMAGFGKDLDETIAAGGWYCPTYHGIHDGWIVTPRDVFARHLAEIHKRRASLWVAPFKNVIQYHRERNSARLTAVSRSKKLWTLMLTDTLTNRRNYDQPLTINLADVTAPVARITRNGNHLPFSQNGSTVTFDAVPGEEVIFVHFKK